MNSQDSSSSQSPSNLEEEINADAETQVIIDEAVKKMKRKSFFAWLLHPASIWGGIILLGPFALPLLWKSKSYSRAVKILVSIGVVGLFVGLMWRSILQALELFEVWRSLQTT